MSKPAIVFAFLGVLSTVILFVLLAVGADFLTRDDRKKIVIRSLAPDRLFCEEEVYFFRPDVSDDVIRSEIASSLGERPAFNQFFEVGSCDDVDIDWNYGCEEKRRTVLFKYYFTKEAFARDVTLRCGHDRFEELRI